MKREGDAWVVVARSGVSEADLAPVPVSIETTQDRVVLRYNTSFASRATLTLHTDGALRGVYRFAFEAKDRQLEYKRVARGPGRAGRPPRRHVPESTRAGRRQRSVADRHRHR